MPYRDPVQQRAYQREWMATRRKAWLDERGPCINCGSTQNLEVDHVNAVQKITHRVWSWSAERREAELNKCVVRCHDCHKKKTAEAHENPTYEIRFRHGSRSMYQKHRCRCKACMNWNKLRRRIERARKAS